MTAADHADALLLQSFIEAREYTAPACMECDGTGEIDSGRSYPASMRCPDCKGTGYVWTADDERASIADALNDELFFERSN